MKFVENGDGTFYCHLGEWTFWIWSDLSVSWHFGNSTGTLPVQYSLGHAKAACKAFAIKKTEALLEVLQQEEK